MTLPPPYRSRLGAIIAKLASWLGCKLMDYRTGAFLGRAFVFSWGGEIYVLGYRGQPFVAEFFPQSRITYWKQKLVFRAHDEVDFPSLLPPSSPPEKPKFANILVTHQPPDFVARMISHWETQVDPAGIWIAYGGKKEAFDAIQYPRKFFLESSRIRVRDLQRERQGYQEIFQKALAHGVTQGVDYVHLAEFDQFPTVPNVNDLQRQQLVAERADVLCYRLERLDGTNHPHNLSHTADPNFGKFFQQLSQRPDPQVVLSALGFGSLWRREAWERVAQVTEPFPIYLEIFLPTVAHHLGCRVRGNSQDLQFTAYGGDASGLLEAARAAGAWFIHPWKSVWNPK